MLSELTVSNNKMTRVIPIDPIDTQGTKIKPLLLIFAIVVLKLIISLFTDGLTFTHEEAMWQYIGRNWLRFGMIPYSDGVDNKYEKYTLYSFLFSTF
jgi:hypothetical protein